MKYLIAAIGITFVITSCKNNDAKIVDKAYVDSLTTHFALPAMALANEKEMVFWKARIDPKNPGQVDESRYASSLIARFHEFGDIQDVKAAEAILWGVNKTYNNKLGSPFLALTSSAILQHHFMQADTLLQTAKKIGIESFTSVTHSFDVDFELGRYHNAAAELSQLKKDHGFDYYFRRSKLDHLNGNIDSATSSMLKAAELAKTSPYLQGIALSNAADLYTHGGDLQKAGDLYRKCIKLNGLDFHSIMGLGWVTLIQDKNDTLAQRLFEFVQSKNKLPDPVFKLYQMAQQRGDKALEKKYAEDFTTKATDPAYGRMYNKYLIEIYTVVLNQPAKAEALAKDELNNRKTPQSFAWYAYALYKNNKNVEAYKVFEQQVSGQPLEGLELYYMGCMMKGLGKGYNAGEFFKAAEKNKFDLSPAMQKDLAANLEE